MNKSNEDDEEITEDGKKEYFIFLSKTFFYFYLKR
jgi:hypothetical protein